MSGRQGRGWAVLALLVLAHVGDVSQAMAVSSADDGPSPVAPTALGAMEQVLRRMAAKMDQDRALSAVVPNNQPPAQQAGVPAASPGEVQPLQQTLLAPQQQPAGSTAVAAGAPGVASHLQVLDQAQLKGCEVSDTVARINVWRIAFTFWATLLEITIETKELLIFFKRAVRESSFLDEHTDFWSRLKFAFRGSSKGFTSTVLMMAMNFAMVTSDFLGPVDGVLGRQVAGLIVGIFGFIQQIKNIWEKRNTYDNRTSSTTLIFAGVQLVVIIISGVGIISNAFPENSSDQKWAYGLYALWTFALLFHMGTVAYRVYNMDYDSLYSREDHNTGSLIKFGRKLNWVGTPSTGPHTLHLTETPEQTDEPNGRFHIRAGEELWARVNCEGCAAMVGAESMKAVTPNTFSLITTARFGEGWTVSVVITAQSQSVRHPFVADVGETLQNPPADILAGGTEINPDPPENAVESPMLDIISVPPNGLVVESRCHFQPHLACPGFTVSYDSKELVSQVTTESDPPSKVVVIPHADLGDRTVKVQIQHREPTGMTDNERPLFGPKAATFTFLARAGAG